MQIDHLFGAWRGWGVATGRSSSSKMYIGQRTPLKRNVSTGSAGRRIGPDPPRLAWLGCDRNGVNTEGTNPVLPSGPCKPPAFPGAIGSTGLPCFGFVLPMSAEVLSVFFISTSVDYYSFWAVRYSVEAAHIASVPTRSAAASKLRQVCRGGQMRRQSLMRQSGFDLMTPAVKRLEQRLILCQNS
jgi:hypothetical protein